MTRLIFMATLLMFLLIFLVVFVALVALLLLAAALLATLLLVTLLLVVTHMISLHGWARKTGRAHNRSDVLAKELLSPFHLDRRSCYPAFAVVELRAVLPERNSDHIFGVSLHNSRSNLHADTLLFARRVQSRQSHRVA